MLSKDIVNEIFLRFVKKNPNPKPELSYINHYTFLVAVVLSAQATDISVNKATSVLFRVVRTPEQMLDLGLDRLIPYIKNIGLYNSKAKNIIKLSEQLLHKFAGKVPNNEQDLLSLAGVGIKTASVVLNCLFNQPVIAVDTHVFRTSNRIGIVDTKSPEATHKPLLAAIPEQWRMNAHHWLILHGRYVCKARTPMCQECTISDYCLHYNQNQRGIVYTV